MSAVSNSKPLWKSYEQTGDPDDMVLAPEVADQIGLKVDGSGGQIASLTGEGVPLLAAIVADAVTPLQYGAAGDGLADDTSALQAAFNSGRNIDLGGKTYLVSASLSLPAAGIHIMGRGATIKTTSATADILTIAQYGTNYVIEDLYLSASVNKTAGWGINARNIRRSIFRNVRVLGQDDYETGRRFYGGIFLNGADTCAVISCTFWGNSYAGLAVCNGSELKIIGGTRFVYNGIGVLCGGSFGGLYIDDTDLHNVCNVRFDTSLTGATNLQAFFGSKMTSDVSGSNGVYIASNSIGYLHAVGTWFASSGQDSLAVDGAQQAGLYVEPNNSTLNLELDGCFFFNNMGCGLFMEGGGTTKVCSTRFWLNGQYGGTANIPRHGFYITNTAGPIDVKACLFQQSAGYDCNVACIPPTLTVVSNTFDLKSGGQFSTSAPLSSMSASYIIRGNSNYATAGGSNNALATGSTTVTVYHGLVAIPQCIQLTPKGPIPVFVVEGSETAKSFQVGISEAQSAPVGFYWWASVGFGA